MFHEQQRVIWQFRKLKSFYGTSRFITKFTGASHWSLSWTKKIQSTVFRPVSLRSSLISSHLHLGFSTGLCLSDILPNWTLSFRSFSQKYVCICLLTHVCQMPTYIIFLHLIILRIMSGELYKLWSSLLSNVLHFPIMVFGAFAKLWKAMGRRLQDVKEVFTSLAKQTNKVKRGGGEIHHSIKKALQW